MPTTHVQRGRVQVTVYTIGDLRASRTVQLAVPPMGGQLQIVQLAETGRRASRPATSSSNSTPPSRSSISSRRASICSSPSRRSSRPTRRRPCRSADDEVALLHARYDVRRAELDMQSNELVSAIKAQQNVLTLDEAKQRLAQLEADVKTHRETTQRIGRRPAREAQQGAAVGAGRRAQHREPARARAVRRLRHGAHELPGVRRHLLSAARCPTTASATRRSPVSRSPTSSTRRRSR